MHKYRYRIIRGDISEGFGGKKLYRTDAVENTALRNLELTGNKEVSSKIEFIIRRLEDEELVGFLEASSLSELGEKVQNHFPNFSREKLERLYSGELFSNFLLYNF